MKKQMLIGCCCLVLFYVDWAHADRPIVLTRNTKVAVDLMDTDLVNKMDLLDCNLRLEGTPQNYKLVYSLGEIPVPAKAVKTIYEGVFVSVAINARIGGMPVSSLFIPYSAKPVRPYRGMNSDVRWGRISTYTISIQKSERTVLKVLRELYGKERVVDRSQFTDLEPGAVLVRSHPEPELFLFGMDGLSGSKERNKTQLYYVCLADRKTNIGDQ